MIPLTYRNRCFGHVDVILYVPLISNIGARVAHFPAGKRETGNGNREISRREMGFFPGNFPVLAKIGLKWAKNVQI